MRSRCLLLAALCATACKPTPKAPEAAPEPEPSQVFRVGIGSCAHQDRPQPIWQSILEAQPDLFLFIGDNIYADTEDPKAMAADYAKLAAKPGFAKLRARVPILPMWDDHDYGTNDGGADYPMKETSQRLLLDFFGVPEDDPRRKRPGIYHAEVFGPPGRRVQVILLDTRYFRGPLVKRPGGDDPILGRYLVQEDPRVTMLGELQWAWLGEQLEAPAEVRLVVSGIQVVANDHGYEKWGNLPHERARLYRLLADKKAAGVILISGDRHKAELSMMDAGLGYPLYDLTASGLNQGHKRWYYFEKNQHRVATMRWGDNFGVIEIDWADEDPEIRLDARYSDGSVAFSHRIRLSTLQPGALPER